MTSADCRARRTEPAIATTTATTLPPVAQAAPSRKMPGAYASKWYHHAKNRYGSYTGTPAAKNQAGPSAGWKPRRIAVHSVAPHRPARTAVSESVIWPQRILVPVTAPSPVKSSATEIEDPK